MTEGPLVGLKVIELAAIGPVPFVGGFLSDLGAQVLRIDSPKKGLDLGDVDSIHLRGRSRVDLNLRDAEDLQTARNLIANSDVLLEGLRPGTLERLGLDPDDLCAANQRLIVGRMTGWGQSGPLAQSAGHDLNYIAMAGALRNFARVGERPVPPLNLVGDFGGGAMFLIAGILAALYERERSGQGQVIDAAMVDGTAYLMLLMYSLQASGMWADTPGTNLLDTGAPFYDVYETADGEYLSVGCLEPKFYAEFISRLGVDEAALPSQHDPEGWPELRRVFATTLAGKTLAEWEEIYVGTDACVYPVRSMNAAPTDPHMAARGVFTTSAPTAPNPAPRFSRTPAVIQEDVLTGAEALAAWLDDAGN